MLTVKKLFVLFSFLVVAAAAIFFIAAPTTAECAPNCREKAGGHGTLIMNGVRRQFSFNAQRNDDGTAKGHAVIHNPGFPPDPRFKGHIDIRCMEVVGNRARVAGIVRKTNDPAFDDNTAVFEVYDNGNPGGDNADTISLVYFSPPNSPPPTPAYCQAFENLPQEPIDNGNIKVDDCP